MMSPHGRSEGRIPPRGDGAQRQGGNMSMRIAALVLCGAAVALAACGEKAVGQSVKKSDVPAYQGSTGASAYVADGWKAGDQSAWEQQLRNRTQGQNEYSRAPSKP